MMQTMTALAGNMTPNPRPVRPEVDRYALDSLRGINGHDRASQLSPEWSQYYQSMDAWKAARRGMHGADKQPNMPVPQAPGQQPQQVAPPPMQAAFAPPGMVGSSYAVRGMIPGATPFDLPTYY